jgi:hypothetical protein
MMPFVFVLEGRRRLEPQAEPTADQAYDEHLQIWIDRRSRLPLVIAMQAQHSRFGETTITETREGADQPEISNLLASQFGETTITRGEGEGADQAVWSDVLTSQFGETTHTAAPEGIDEPRLSNL